MKTEVEIALEIRAMLDAQVRSCLMAGQAATLEKVNRDRLVGIVKNA